MLTRIFKKLALIITCIIVFNKLIAGNATILEFIIAAIISIL